MEFLLVILVGGIAFAVGLAFEQGRIADLVTECQAQIEAQGGRYLDHERRTLRSGPFMWAGKGQIILRVRWVDAKGRQRQLWVKRSGWPMGDKFVWDYDDGE